VARRDGFASVGARRPRCRFGVRHVAAAGGAGWPDPVDRRDQRQRGSVSTVPGLDGVADPRHRSLPAVLVANRGEIAVRVMRMRMRGRMGGASLSGPGW
jgi:hypothetical protein